MQKSAKQAAEMREQTAQLAGNGGHPEGSTSEICH